MYDWAISGMQAVIIASVFPIFFADFAGYGLEGSRATQALSNANFIAAALVAFLAPILGALADYAAVKKKLTAAFMLVGVIGTAGMFLIRQGDLGLAMAAVVNAVNTLIIDRLESDVELVENIGHYIVEAGGKRLRPLLVLLAARACGCSTGRRMRECRPGVCRTWRQTGDAQVGPPRARNLGCPAPMRS